MDCVLNIILAVSALSVALVFLLFVFFVEDMITIARITKAAGREVTFRHMNSMAKWVAANPSRARLLQAMMLTGSVVLPFVGWTAGTWTGVVSVFLDGATGSMTVVSLCYAAWITYKAVTNRSSQPHQESGPISRSAQES
ncbi:MAG: hypothetical protein C4K49_07660 [Candidatus Thorarchaeota archaeon]|nr:MAG: hypothetical protein C4K49_07660 [Candidatus Thorarchaeota archaeon]